MKNYFNFNLSGKQFFPIWLLFYVLVLLPYFGIIFFANKTEAVAAPLLALLLIIVGSFTFYFYMAKLFINHTRYNGESLVFSGKFSSYIGMVLKGFFLSIITLGIYYAWFTRDMMRFFVNQTWLRSAPFKFKGEGATLFVILLLTMLPIMLISLLMGIIAAGKTLSGGTPEITYLPVVIQLITFVVLIPFMYYLYKWMVDVEYKEYRIKWKTDFWQSCVQILIQVALTVITLGIYFPLLYLKLYKYFAERTFAESPAKTMNFGYELEPQKDFLFVWGQTLLSIITLGFYYPWAIVKIYNRVFSKTYTRVVSEQQLQTVTPPPLPYATV